ncbi:MAG: hypothetical protein RLZZ387_5457 [Chloroflexota bacterium]
MRIGLIPLDERPVNTRYPQMIAAAAGAEVLLPPRETLSDLRTPANCAALADWLRETAPTMDALIACVEMVGYGGLIASRTTDDPLSTVLARLEVLREVKVRRPTMPLLAFSVITRISNADYNLEEPLYWDRYGTRLYRLSQLMDRARQGEQLADELASLRAAIPPEHQHDFLRRRHRNHAVNLAAVHMLAEGAFDLLVLSSDDTSPYGLGSREKRWVAEMADRLGLLDGEADGDKAQAGAPAVGAATAGVQRLLMYPGADEVGCALLARLLNQAHGATPRMAPFYAVPGGAEIVAPYEDGPVRVTVERQIRACGAALAPEGADGDIWLAVNPPVPRRSEWAPEHADQERSERTPHLRMLAAQIRRRQDNGRPVVLADVAYPNGADPALIDAVSRVVRLPALAAYGAWNTAGNTIGTALTQGCAALLARTEEGRAAQEHFLLHRFVEDWGYQQVVRREARDWLLQTVGRDDPLPEELDATRAFIEPRLSALIDELPGFAGRWRIAPGSTRLPWRRLFEVDFDLERTEAL